MKEEAVALRCAQLCTAVCSCVHSCIRNTLCTVLYSYVELCTLGAMLSTAASLISQRETEAGADLGARRTTTAGSTEGSVSRASTIICAGVDQQPPSGNACADYPYVVTRL